MTTPTYQSLLATESRASGGGQVGQLRRQGWDRGSPVPCEASKAGRKDQEFSFPEKLI